MIESSRPALKTAWRFCSCASFRHDTDHRLLFRKETSIPGVAWATFKPTLRKISRDPNEIIWTDLNRSSKDVGHRHRYTHRLLWDELEWMLAIPVAREPSAPKRSTDWVVDVRQQYSFGR